uniref:Uncharacterized protein n=1 Tax=Acrobeloides nanus TaxID=290746 RepID=A0A914E4H8_9BILA
MGLFMDAYDCCPMSTTPLPTTTTTTTPTTPMPTTSYTDLTINCTNTTNYFTILYCNVTNGTVTGGNVGNLANQTTSLLNSTTTPLNSTTVSMASVILSTLTEIKNVTYATPDFIAISKLADTILNANADTFKESDDNFKIKGVSITQRLIDPYMDNSKSPLGTTSTVAGRDKHAMSKNLEPNGHSLVIVKKTPLALIPTPTIEDPKTEGTERKKRTKSLFLYTTLY